VINKQTNKQNKQLSRFKNLPCDSKTIIRSPSADDDVNKLLRGCCVDAFISDCALPKRVEDFFKNNNKFREENVFKTIKKKKEK